MEGKTMGKGFTRYYLEEVQRVTAALDSEKVDHVVYSLFQAWRNEQNVFILGNGGSAATSSHFACDLAKMTVVEDQKRLKVMALTDNVPLMTAWANDTDYSQVFIEPLRAFVRSGDIVLGITGSGNSANVLRALEYANASGAYTIAFTGYGGGKVKDIARFSVIVPSCQMQVIEDVHSLMTHAISLQLRAMILDYRTSGHTDLIPPRDLRNIYS
jgi:D-sedoheptulose 7-phosphate isomerase